MNARPAFKLALLATVCFTFATIVRPSALKWVESERTEDVMKMLLGDGRKILAEQLSRQADVYFHSGYYPSFFDQANMPNRSQSPMVSGETEPFQDEEDHEGEAEHDHEHDAHHEKDEHEKEMAFLGKPLDWIEAFGRHFRITEHTHLSAERSREILPWLRMSAAFDPQRVETYTVAAYWMRRQLGKTQEAEKFLRQGLRENPGSYEILFELGRLYRENMHDPQRAVNMWELALRRWNENQARKDNPDYASREKIAANLGRAEEELGHYDRAIAYLELAKKDSPAAAELERQIEELKKLRDAGKQEK